MDISVRASLSFLRTIPSLNSQPAVDTAPRLVKVLPLF